MNDNTDCKYLQLTVADLANRLKRSVAGINALKDKGRLTTDSKIINGRLTTVVTLDEKSMTALNIEPELVNVWESEQKPLITEIELVNLFLQQIDKLKNELVEKAEITGQVKLLTADNKFYQEEYFRLKYENDKLQAENQQLKEELKKPRWKLWK